MCLLRSAFSNTEKLTKRLIEACDSPRTVFLSVVLKSHAPCADEYIWFGVIRWIRSVEKHPNYVVDGRWEKGLLDKSSDCHFQHTYQPHFHPSCSCIFQTGSLGLWNCYCTTKFLLSSWRKNQNTAQEKTLHQIHQACAHRMCWNNMFGHGTGYLQVIKDGKRKTGKVEFEGAVTDSMYDSAEFLWQLRWRVSELMTCADEGLHHN